MNKLTIAGDIRRIERKNLDVVGHNYVGSIHETKIGASVKHVEVYAASVVENVCQNLRKF